MILPTCECGNPTRLYTVHIDPSRHPATEHCFDPVELEGIEWNDERES